MLWISKLTTFESQFYALLIGFIQFKSWYFLQVCNIHFLTDGHVGMWRFLLTIQNIANLYEFDSVDATLSISLIYVSI